MPSSLLWDIVWSKDKDGTVGDWAMAADGSGALQRLDEVGTAIIICLFTNARLPDEWIDNVNYTREDQKTWHGNLFDAPPDEAEIGSLLWTIRRRTLTDEIVRLAQYFATEALKPLIKYNWVEAFDVDAQAIKPDRLELIIHAYVSKKDERIYTATISTVA